MAKRRRQNALALAPSGAILTPRPGVSSARHPQKRRSGAATNGPRYRRRLHRQGRKPLRSGSAREPPRAHDFLRAARSPSNAITTRTRSWRCARSPRRRFRRRTSRKSSFIRCRNTSRSTSRSPKGFRLIGAPGTGVDADDTEVITDRMSEEELLKGLEGLTPPENQPEPEADVGDEED